MRESRLRIAMLSVHSCPVGALGTRDTGGMSVYIRELAAELGCQGHRVDVYTRVHDSADKQVYELGGNARLIHLKAGGSEEIHKLAVYPHLPDFACNLEGFRRQENCQYDLISSHYWLSALTANYLQQWWHIPHITMFHTMGLIKNRVGIGEDEPELRIEMERQMVATCQRIIAATEKEKADIVQLYGGSPERISVIPCGVNLELFRPVEKAAAKRRLGLGEERLILCIGRIEPLKGIDRLIQAMPLLGNGRSPTLVVVGGDGDSEAEIGQLRQLADTLHVRDSVIFRGRVQHERLPDYYSAADVCVVPSFYESFGLVALEALACGAPVVATDVGNLSNIIRQGETGYVVADNQPQHLAEKIARFVTGEEKGPTFASSIRESVTRFAWPNIAREFVGECYRLLAEYDKS